MQLARGRAGCSALLKRRRYQALLPLLPNRFFDPYLSFLSERFSLAVLSGFFLVCCFESNPLLMIFTSDNVVVGHSAVRHCIT